MEVITFRRCLCLRLLLLLSPWAASSHALGETAAKGGLSEGAGGVRSSDWFFQVQRLDVSVMPVLSRTERNVNRSITIEFRSGSHHLVVDIHPTSDLLAGSYHESSDTKKVDNNVTECDFQGQVRGHPDSWAALSICEGIRGVVVSQGRELLVEPSRGTETPEGTHRIFSSQRVEASGRCGVEDGHNRQTISTSKVLRRERRASLHGPLWTNKMTRFIELVLVVDRNFYSKFGDKTHSRCRAMVNIVNAMYRPLGIVVVLTGIEVWKTRDEVRVTSAYKALLDEFKKYRQKFLKARPALPNDNMALITRVDFDGNTVGYASVKGMCSNTDSVSVVQDKNDAVGIVAQTLAHEMGHNLGMNHDDGNCTCKHSCVMDGTGSNIYNTSMGWSSCSKNYLAQGFSSASFDCLKNIPTTFFGGSSCGNGVVEEGEQCDCGPSEFCNNPCCDHITCRLAVNATCASGSCCDVSICKPKPVATMCRSALSECDLPEYCPGDSEYCPPDVFKRDGLQCFQGTGHCYKGECGSHEQRCQAIWGPTSSVSKDECYNLNKRGSSDGNCGFVDSDLINLKKCPKESIRCGSLHCTSSSSTPESNYFWGTLLLPVNKEQARCQFLLVHEGTPNKFWLSPDGGTCGPNKMCIDQQCRSIAEPDGVSECPNGCSGNGVCNSKGNCHCDAGFGPPDCSASGYGGSFDSGHMEEPQVGNPVLKGLLIFAFLLIACTVIFCCMFSRLRRWWEKRGRTCVTSCLPCFATCVDSCCCFLMAKFTHWVVSAGPLGKEKHAVQRQVEEKTGGDRTTICQVNVDFNDQLSSMNSWGVADTKLMTDIVTITPKNSPDFRRKVQLPSDSPVLHHKSNERLDRPKYLQSLSVDSGCIVDDEEVITKEPVSSQMSMSSLVTAFKKFSHKGSKTPERELDRPRFPRQGSKTPDRDLGRPPLTTQKSMPLSRFVVDPLAGNRSSRQGTPPPEDMRHDLRRSVSTDVASAFSTKLHGNGPPPPPTALKPHKSEDNIHSTRENPFFPPDKIMAPPGGPRGSSPAASSSNESLDGRPRMPVLPPQVPGTNTRPSRVAPPPPPPSGQKKPKGPPKMPSGGKGGPPKPPDASSKPNGSPNSSVKDMIRRMETK